MSNVILQRISNSIEDAVNKCIGKSGGIQNFLSTGDKILIKPNFVGPIGSEHGATTDPELVAILAKIAVQNGAKRVYIAESSATCFSTKNVVQKIHLKNFLDELKDDRIQFVDLDEERTVRVNTPQDFFLKKIPVPELLTKVDHIWNVPKAKVHYIDVVTCAVKNYVGFLPREFRLSFHQSRLSHVVAIMHKLFPESLVFADATVIGEGEGPLNVKPILLGYLLVSNDPVAIDVTVGKIFGFQPQEIEFVMNLFNMGIGDINPSCLIDTSDLEVFKTVSTLRRPVKGIVGRYKPFRIILGGACYGCLTWLKGTLEGWMLDGTMSELEKINTKISVMIGYNAVDERIDEFIQTPYVVIGDCAPEKYKNDSRVIHISGCCPGEKISSALEKIISNIKKIR